VVPTARILIVEDDETTAELIGEELVRRGAEIRCAATGHDALVAAGELHPMLALIDLRLPDMSGIEVGRRLHDAAGDDRLVLAAYTGWLRTSDIDDALAAGFDYLLVKPVSFAAIHALVEASNGDPRVSGVMLRRLMKPV
jgi:DNA-binding response OmpR family regulator